MMFLDDQHGGSFPLDLATVEVPVVEPVGVQECYAQPLFVREPVLAFDWVREGALWLNRGREGETGKLTGPGGGADPVALGDLPGFLLSAASLSRFSGLAPASVKVGSRTMMFWARPVAQGGFSLAWVPSGSDYHGYLGFNALDTTKILVFSHRTSTGAQQITQVIGGGIVEEWHHYAVTVLVEGSNVRVCLYRDGVELHSATYTSGWWETYQNTIYLGCYYPGSGHYTGELAFPLFVSQPWHPDSLRATFQQQRHLFHI